MTIIYINPIHAFKMHANLSNAILTINLHLNRFTHANLNFNYPGTSGTRICQ